MQEEQKMADDFNVHVLIGKYTDNNLTEAERRQLDAWAGSSPERKELLLKAGDKQFVEAALQKMYGHDTQAGWEKLQARMPQAVPVVPMPRRRRIQYAVAASVAVLAMAGAYFFFANRSSDQSAGIVKAVNLPANYKNDVLPGGNKAMLTLADGSQIALDDAANGTLTEQGSTKVVKTADGQLSYNTGNSPGKMQNSAVTYNILSTPRGGLYQVALPDGSLVWLNAASRLRYPTSFAASERIVDISGEAYFEIAHLEDGQGRRVPFKVNVLHASPGAGAVQVEVLGTHFNVMAYDDERSMNTTLLEGAVKITNGSANQVIAPGQQAQVGRNGSIIVKKDANLETTMAWKNGLFDFEYEDISTIMRQMARWYNIEVVFEGKLPDDHFKATISRAVPVSKLLQILELTDHVHFRVEGKRVTVSQ